MISGPWRITFDTNPDDCNLRCVMCEEHSEFSGRTKVNNRKRKMDIGLIEKTVKELVPHGLTEIIPSTMGEPLLYSEFDRIIKIVNEAGIKMNLTTNGTFPRRTVAQWAQLLAPISSDIKISWNGFNPDTQESIMRGISHAKKLNNMKKFLAERNRIQMSGRPVCSMTLQMTFMKSNFRELPDLISLAAELGVERVKGHHIWAHSYVQAEWSLLNNKRSIGEWNRVVRQSEERAKEEFLRRGNRVKLENIETLEADEDRRGEMFGECPFLGKEAWLNTAGEFDVCCAPHEKRRKLANFGSVESGSLLEIWNSEQYRSLVDSYRSQAICKKCNMRKRVAV